MDRKEKLARIEEILRTCPVMHDRIFPFVFKDNLPLVQKTVNIILRAAEEEEVVITESNIEEPVLRLGTEHGIRLDVLAITREQDFVNMEFQSEYESFVPARSAYYAALLFPSHFDKGKVYSTIPKRIIIFVCNFDPLKKGKPLYVARTMVKIDEEFFPLEDNYRLILVNGLHKADDELGLLVRDLTTPPLGGTFVDELIRNRVKNLISTEGKSMFERKYYDKWSREERADAQVETLVSVISNMLKKGCDWKMIRDFVKVPDTILPEILKIFPEYAKA